MVKGYDFELYYSLGGCPEEPPYVDFVKDLQGEEIRIFVCADCLTWKEFSKLAAAAAQAHLMRKSPLYAERLVKKDALPISSEPHYILEDLGNATYAVYINISCPNEAEYEATKSLARIKIGEVTKAKKRFGDPLWKTQIKADFTQYPVSDNMRSEAQAFLRRLGI